MTKEEIMVVVKPAIYSKLQNPASAQFPVDNISISGNDETGYTVKGFVDWQNSHGARIGNEFCVKILMVEGDPIVVSSAVGAQKAKKPAKTFGLSYVAVTLITIIGGAIISLLISAIVAIL